MILEAEQFETKSDYEGSEAEAEAEDQPRDSDIETTQNKIDQIRAKVTEINNRLEANI